MVGATGGVLSFWVKGRGYCIDMGMWSHASLMRKREPLYKLLLGAKSMAWSGLAGSGRVGSGRVGLRVWLDGTLGYIDMGRPRKGRQIGAHSL